MLGIKEAFPGNKLHDISSAIQVSAEKNGYSVVRNFVGHGVGTQLHEEPQVPNFGMPGTGPELRVGMVLAIEPMLNQGTESVKVLEDKWTVVTEEQPNENQLEDLKFAWKAIRHVKSNAIIVVKDRSIRGMGAGQPNRVISFQLAIDKAGTDGVQGAVLASDAFFPFADGLELALDAGIKSVVQPGGSIRDEEVINAANNKGASMILTGVRHFRH